MYGFQKEFVHYMPGTLTLFLNCRNDLTRKLTFLLLLSCSLRGFYGLLQNHGNFMLPLLKNKLLKKSKQEGKLGLNWTRISEHNENTMLCLNLMDLFIYYYYLFQWWRGACKLEFAVLGSFLKRNTGRVEPKLCYLFCRYQYFQIFYIQNCWQIW